MEQKPSAIKRILPFVRPYRWLIAGAVALSFVEVVAEAAIPEITKRIIDGPIKAGLAQRAQGLPATEASRLWTLAGLLVVLALVVSGMAGIRRLWLARSSHGMETDLRDRLYAKLQDLHVSFHDSWQSGQLLSRAIYDIGAIRRMVGFGAPFIVILSFQFVYVVVLMYLIDVPLATLTALGVLPVGWVSYRYAKRYKVIARKVQDQQGDLTTTIEEASTGIRIIKAFGRGPQVIRRFTGEASALYDTNMERVSLNTRMWPSFELVPNIVLLSILVIGGRSVIAGGTGLTLGELIQFIGYIGMLVWPIDALGWILAMSVESRTATERIWEVLDAPVEVADKPNAKTVSHSEGRLEFKGVWFRYSQERDWVLKEIDLEVEPGETLALVGKTGCGKSSLAMLVPRLYEASKGKVKLDGTDISDLKLSSLRSHVGVAFEDPILFSASVLDNLLMGRPDAPDDEIRGALETAEASFVYDLPWGLETRVGEQGYTLSGGQRQRLALARAVLGRPRVLVLDDPLSSVDVHTEAVIEEALERVLDGVTAILVVHRPSTLALADRVALIDEGRVAAIGKHSDLMANDPLYRAVLSQEAEEIEVSK